MQNKYFQRAQFAVMHAYQSTGYGLMTICEPDNWPPCAAREVALHALDGLAEGHSTVESWINFPGGWPRFLDMFEPAAKNAKFEQGDSAIDTISLTMANEILKGKHD